MYPLYPDKSTISLVKYIKQIFCHSSFYTNLIADMLEYSPRVFKNE